MQDRQCYTVAQFSVTFNVGRTKLYEEIKSGKLRTYKIGRRRYISTQAASSYQQQLELETSQEGTPADMRAL